MKLTVFLIVVQVSVHTDFNFQRFMAALPSKSFFQFVLLEVLCDKSVETFISVVLRNGQYCDIKSFYGDRILQFSVAWRAR